MSRLLGESREEYNARIRAKYKNPEHNLKRRVVQRRWRANNKIKLAAQRRRHKEKVLNGQPILPSRKITKAKKVKIQSLLAKGFSIEEVAIILGHKLKRHEAADNQG